MYRTRCQTVLAACCLSIVSALTCTVFIAGHAKAEPEQQPALSGEDKQFLDSLIAEFLFDPKGAQRVSIKTAMRNAWRTEEQATIEGWQVPAGGAKPGNVFSADGFPVPLRPGNEITQVDFVAACRARYDAPKDRNAAAKEENAFDLMRLTALGIVDSDLMQAAWLHRLSHDGLAAKALAAARRRMDVSKPLREDLRDALRETLAWSAFAGMVHAYIVRADDEALAYGGHLMRLYPKEAEKRFPQAARILKEIKRRQQSGPRAQQLAAQPPEDFKLWEEKKRVAFLIDALDEADARQWGQPGGVDLASDWRVRDLINLGGAAVPDLIDTLENDTRLTRSVHFWRDFAPSRTVLGVREAALTAAMSILRTRVFEPHFTGDNFTSHGEGAAKEAAKALRDYWNTYGRLPFEERMMHIMTDPKASFDARRDAAKKLAALNERESLQTTLLPYYTDNDFPLGENPAVKKFRNPTVAEAILATMDADLNAYDAQNRNDTKERRQIYDGYVWALDRLRDTRIAPEAVKRAAAAPALHERLVWAYAAHRLGDGKPFEALASEFRAGQISIAQIDNASIDPKTHDELETVVSALISIGTPAADGALNALADPKHPLNGAAAAEIWKELVNPVARFHSSWFEHPYCIPILASRLDDDTPSGGTYSFQNDYIIKNYADGGYASMSIPAFLAGPASRLDKAEERHFDIVAAKISSLVMGTPRYHPLLKDAGQRLTKLKSTVKQFGGNLRRLNAQEKLAFFREPDGPPNLYDGPPYIPDIRPLGRAATVADVNAGKAIFYLEQGGKPAAVKLPATAVLKSDPAERLLIVQAETRPDGETVLGAISESDIRMVLARDVADMKSLAEPEKE